MGMFECKLQNGNKYIVTGVLEVNNDDGILRIITETFIHFILSKNIKKYTINF